MRKEILSSEQRPQSIGNDYWLDDRHLDYHRRQFVEPYRSTVALGEFVLKILGNGVREQRAAIDVGCGAGANIFHLSRILREARWTGIDMADSLFKIGQTFMKAGAHEPAIDFLGGDFFHLNTLVAANSFDIGFSIQTVSWLPNYSEFIRQFLKVIRPGGVAFVTSLFTDFLVDARIEITEFDDHRIAHERGFYNVYSAEQFTRYCLSLGAREVVWQPFDIDIALSEPSHRRMGTYTRQASDGKLWQFSGPLAMPWQFAAIRM